MMKNSRNYVEHEVSAQLSKKHDISIRGRAIQILTGSSAKNDIGIKSKGKIDFLTKYCGFYKEFVKKFAF